MDNSVTMTTETTTAAHDPTLDPKPVNVFTPTAAPPTVVENEEEEEVEEECVSALQLVGGQSMFLL